LKRKGLSFIYFSFFRSGRSISWGFYLPIWFVRVIVSMVNDKFLHLLVHWYLKIIWSRQLWNPNSRKIKATVTKKNADFPGCSSVCDILYFFVEEKLAKCKSSHMNMKQNKKIKMTANNSFGILSSWISSKIF